MSKHNEIKESAKKGPQLSSQNIFCPTGRRYRNKKPQIMDLVLQCPMCDDQHTLGQPLKIECMCASGRETEIMQFVSKKICGLLP